MIRERAPAKVNLVLHVGPRREDGLHELCSLFASIDIADELTISEAANGADSVSCPGVEGPNLCGAALAELRAVLPRGELPPLAVTVEKRIPVAAGLGGGSADAAAVLRGANQLIGSPLGPAELRSIAARVGADVPSQVDPGHALVRGAGEIVEPLPLASTHVVLLPREGLATAEVYGEADRIGCTRASLDPGAVRALARRPARALAPALENDLQAAALSLRPELREPLAALERAGALAALLTGSGPTAFGVFEDAAGARAAAEELPAALVTAIA